jgi:hypothetical protein
MLFLQRTTARILAVTGKAAVLDEKTAARIVRLVSPYQSCPMAFTR